MDPARSEPSAVLPMETIIPKDLSTIDTFTFESNEKLGEIVRERIKRVEDHDYSDQYIASQGVRQNVGLGREQAITEQRKQSFIDWQCYAKGLNAELETLRLSALELQEWYKEADSSWGICTISPEFRPTLALEIGVSKPEDRMSLDALDG